ncbi:MAG: SEL1-like repeat protein, partial [Bacteroidales bacterium]|nr:SEL1-like repeat protein [Bacteroidales bacterium]
EAVKLFKKSADMENDRAQYNLGQCYYYGEGVKQNLKKAKEYFELAADQDCEEAIEFLNENEF